MRPSRRQGGFRDNSPSQGTERKKKNKEKGVRCHRNFIVSILLTHGVLCKYRQKEFLVALCAENVTVLYSLLLNKHRKSHDLEYNS